MSVSAQDKNQLCLYMKGDLEIVNEWLFYNCLAVNWGKTNFMILNDKDADQQITIGPNTLSQVQETKLLGVIIDQNLSFNSHVKQICSKVNRKAFLISRNFRLFSPKFRIILFKLFILPNFDYCSTLLIQSSSLNMEKLRKCYKRNIKLFLKIDLSNQNVYEQFSSLSHLNVLPLSIRLLTRFTVLAHSILRTDHENELSSYLIKQGSSRQLRQAYIIPPCRTNLWKASFTNSVTKLLNAFLAKHLSLSRKKLNELLSSRTLEFYDKVKEILG